MKSSEPIRASSLQRSSQEICLVGNPDVGGSNPPLSAPYSKVQLLVHELPNRRVLGNSSYGAWHPSCSVLACGTCYVYGFYRREGSEAVDYRAAPLLRSP